MSNYGDLTVELGPEAVGIEVYDEGELVAELSTGITVAEIVAADNSVMVELFAGVPGVQGDVGPQGLQGLVWRGVWDAGTAYVEADGVEHDGSSYIALSATTLGAEPSVTPAEWDALATGLQWAGSWDAGAAYVANQLVEHEGTTYISLDATTTGATPPDTPAEWDVIASGLFWAGAWSDASTYLVNHVVQYNGSTYIALTTTTLAAPPSTTLGEWGVLVSGLKWFGAWDAGTAYDVNSVVERSGTAYIAVAQTTPAATPETTPAEWEVLAEKGDTGATGATGSTGAQGARGMTWQGPWDSGTAYAADDAVEYLGSSYVAISTTTAFNDPITNSPAEWEILAEGGSQGVDGAGVTWRGPWNTALTYAINDGVEYQGSAYVATAQANPTEHPVGFPGKWDLFASKGDPGPNGPGTPSYDEGLHSARPASTGSGMVWYSTNIGQVFLDTAAGWWKFGRAYVTNDYAKWVVPSPEPETYAWYVSRAYTGGPGYAAMTTNGGVTWFSLGGVSALRYWASFIHMANYNQVVHFGAYTSTSTSTVYDPFIAVETSISGGITVTAWQIGRPAVYGVDTDGYRVVMATNGSLKRHDGEFNGSSTYINCVGMASGAYYTVKFMGGLWFSVGNTVMATSEDGHTWTAQTPPDPASNYWGIAFRQSDQKVWVSDATNRCLWVTQDFVNWAQIDYATFADANLAYTGQIARVIAYANGILCISLDGGAPKSLLWSDDEGLTWNVGAETYHGSYPTTPYPYIEYYKDNTWLWCVHNYRLFQSDDNAVSFALKHTYSPYNQGYGFKSIEVGRPDTREYIQKDMTQTHNAISAFNFRAYHYSATTLYDVEGTNHMASTDVTAMSSASTKWSGIEAYKPDGTQADLVSAYVIEQPYTFAFMMAMPDDVNEKVFIYWDADNYLAVVNDTIKWRCAGTDYTPVASGLPLGATTPFIFVFSHDGTTAKAWLNGTPTFTQAKTLGTLGLYPKYIRASVPTGAEIIMFAHSDELLTNLEVYNQWLPAKSSIPAYVLP